MTTLSLLLLLSVLTIILIKSASLIEGSLIVLSKKIGISPFITGFVVLSIASTLPEISLTINSSVQDVPDLAIGNLLGASVFLLTFVVGIFAIKHKVIPFRGSFGRSELILSLGFIALHTLVLLDKKLTFFEGLMILFGYIALVFYLVLKSKNGHHDIHKNVSITTENTVKAILKSIAGIVLLIVSSNLMVRTAINLASSLQVSETLIGLGILSIGTNLPELAIVITCKTADEDKLAIGNLVGSAVINVPTLGLLGILLPHTIKDVNLLFPAVIALIIASILFSIFAWTNRNVSRREGIFLLIVFILLVITEFIIIG